jgi:aromatic ring hydroxylase
MLKGSSVYYETINSLLDTRALICKIITTELLTGKLKNIRECNNTAPDTMEDGGTESSRSR